MDMQAHDSFEGCHSTAAAVTAASVPTSSELAYLLWLVHYQLFALLLKNELPHRFFYS